MTKKSPRILFILSIPDEREKDEKIRGDVNQNNFR